jgi:hypothetical protein
MSDNAFPSQQQPSAPAPGRFTLERLSSAFARLMGTTPTARKPAVVAEDDALAAPAGDAVPVSPRMIVEGLLFVGAPDGRPLPSRELAAQIRNVTPGKSTRWSRS